MTVRVVLIVLSILISACTPPTDAGGKRISYIGVDRVDDDERGVTCYVYRTYAISCLKRQ